MWITQKIIPADTKAAMSCVKVPNPNRKAVTAPTFISTEGHIQTYSGNPFYIQYYTPYKTRVYIDCPVEDTTLVLAGSNQTITGQYTFTQPVSGVAPVVPSDFATKAYVDAAVGGGVPDEYISKGSAAVITVGPPVVATAVGLPAGKYSVELKAILTSGGDAATLYQNFCGGVGPFSGDPAPAQFAGSISLQEAEFSLSSAVGGIEIRCGGVAATWKVIYKIMAA